ncbi:hypothetical protein ACTFIU_007937 [Dictyostelium citrinum]
MKIIKLFIILVIAFVSFSVYNNFNQNKIINNSSNGFSSQYEFYQSSEEIKKRDDNCRIESMDFSRLNENLFTENRGFSDIIVGDKDIETISYIGLDSFKCSLEFNDVYLTPSNIWNVLILGLNKLVEPREYSSLVEKNQTLILQNSIFNRNNHYSNDEIEMILIDEISKKINSTFKELLLPKFESSSSSSSRDQLIFLTNAIGYMNGIYDYGILDCRVPSCFVNNTLPKNIHMVGNIEDYEKMLVNIKSIYNLLYDDLNLNGTSFQLFEWYSKNTFIIESIIKYMRDQSYKGMDLNYFINKFDSSNTLRDFINYSHARGFSFIPIEIINENDLVYQSSTKINLFAGHFGSNIILPKSIHGGLSILEPKINWVITKYQNK